MERFSRSLRDVVIIMERLGNVGAGFRSLTEAIDTTSPAGRTMMQMDGAFAEFERAMLRERTMDGLDAARLEARVGTGGWHPCPFLPTFAPAHPGAGRLGSQAAVLYALAR
jgi:DNA invertase Pin-like site-specific DNA recombinase